MSKGNFVEYFLVLIFYALTLGTDLDVRDGMPQQADTNAFESLMEHVPPAAWSEDTTH